MVRAAVEMAKEWRTDRMLRRLEALLLVADKERLLLLSGSGEVIEPDDGVAAIGSGGPHALAAARPCANTPSFLRGDCGAAMAITARICIYTNDQIHIEELEA